MTDKTNNAPYPTHEAAMEAILAACGVTTLSYEEAIAIYLRGRGILRDGARVLGSPIPPGWTPDVAPAEVPANWRDWHGWVRPRPDGAFAKCGGPALCRHCQGEKAMAGGTVVSTMCGTLAGQRPAAV